MTSGASSAVAQEMLPTLSPIETTSSSSSSQRKFTSAPTSVRGGTTASHSSAPSQHARPQLSFAGLDACTSAHDLLRVFVSSETTLTSVATSLEQHQHACSPSPLLPLPPSWTSPGMTKARTAIAAHLSDMMMRCTRRADANSPASSLESFLVFLITAEPDILRAVRQRKRALTTRSAATHMGDQPHSTCCADDDGKVEKDAIMFLRCCAARLVAKSRQKARMALRGEAVVGESARSPLLPCWRTCSALSLLRSSSRPPSAAERDSPYWCSTGCEGLDGALGGAGFRSGWVTEVYGEAGAGKTQLGLQCLLEQAATDLCRSAVALWLVHQPSCTSLLTCREVFDTARTEALRCAVVYLVSEDVPTSRLGPLAAAAVRRAVRAIQLHPLLTQLPSTALDGVRRAVRQACTVTMVLSRLHIRRVASLREVLRLVEPTGPPQPSGASDGRGHCTLTDAVRMLGGTAGQAVIVLDSIAAAVVAGQSDMRGVAQEDASVAAAARHLRSAASFHNWCVVVMNQVRAVPSVVRTPVPGTSWVRTTRARSPPLQPSSSTSHSSGAQAIVPALGFAWSGAAQCRVQLRKSLSPGVRQLILRQSPASPPSQVSYIITQNGIEDA